MSEHERLDELGRFLKERRARIGPAQVGLPAGPRRRVRGLRREEVASLAGLGVSWYTAIENGSADGVSEAALLAIADVLRLSASERRYMLDLIDTSQAAESAEVPDKLTVDTLHALSFPAYIITAAWDVVDFNATFGRVWSVDRRELPFNAVERLFLDPTARKLHADHFSENITPVIAMLRSSHGRRPYWGALRKLRDRLLTDDTTRIIWDAYEIVNPTIPNICTLELSIGPFRYETLTLPISGTMHGIVVQVPDSTSVERLAHPLRTTKNAS